MVKTLSSHREGQRFDPWSRKILHVVQCDQKKRKEKKIWKMEKIITLNFPATIILAISHEPVVSWLLAS